MHEQRLPHARDPPDPELFARPPPHASTSQSQYIDPSAARQRSEGATEGEGEAEELHWSRRFIMRYPMAGYAIAVGTPWAMWTLWRRYGVAEDDVVLIKGKDSGFLDGLQRGAHATSGGDKRVEL
jgi:hypothetical protein